MEMEIEFARPLEMEIYSEYTDFQNIKHLEFAHFSTPQRCAEFVSFLRENGIPIRRICCMGNGCLIPNKTNQEIKLLVARFKLETPTQTNTELDSETPVITTECGVCLKDVNSTIMVNVCANNGHDTCVTCYTHLKTMAFSCPFCRGKLK